MCGLPALKMLQGSSDEGQSCPSGAEEAAEKGQIRDEFEQDIPRWLKPEIDLMDFSGTDKSVPFQNLSFG
jgi:hypothetical protein